MMGLYARAKRIGPNTQLARPNPLPPHPPRLPPHPSLSPSSSPPFPPTCHLPPPLHLPLPPQLSRVIHVTLFGLHADLHPGGANGTTFLRPQPLHHTSYACYHPKKDVLAAPWWGGRGEGMGRGWGVE